MWSVQMIKIMNKIVNIHQQTMYTVAESFE